MDKVGEMALSQLFADGLLKKELLDGPYEEYRAAVNAIVDSLDFVILTDHTSDLLRQAERFYSVGKYEFSRLFYATFFEHALNSIINIKCQRLNLSDKVRVEIIKSVNINGKLSWLLTILGCKKFNDKHAKTINILSQERNAFVHYKWNPSDDEPADTDGEFLTIKQAVKYIKLYRTRLDYNHSKATIKRKLRTITGR